MNKFPKVLIINLEPFNSTSGTGITLSNIFGGWDSDSIAQIYMSDLSPDYNICKNYFKLSPKILPFDYYIRNVVSLFKKSKPQSNKPAAISKSSNKISLKNTIHLNSRAIADLSLLQIPDELLKFVEKFNPDIIYSTLGNIWIIKLTNEISSRIKKPIVPHFMDDWTSSLYFQNELFGLARKRFDDYFNLLLTKSSFGLCISEQMAKEYNKRYNLPFYSFANSIDDSLFSPPNNIEKKDKFTLLYVGGLHLNRWKSILDISEAVEQLNKNGIGVTFEIFCPNSDFELYKKKFADFTSTMLGGELRSNQVPLKLKDCDMLVHVESFEENYVKYTKFSLSTKIPQYMASGKPIFGYGPNSLASIQHIVKAKAGKTVENKSVSEVIDVLSKLIIDEKSLKKYALNGFNFAKIYHSKSYNTKRLIDILNND